MVVQEALELFYSKKTVCKRPLSKLNGNIQCMTNIQEVWDLISKKTGKSFKNVLEISFKKNNINPEDIKGISTDSMREGFILYDENQKELIGFSNIDARAKEEVISLKKEHPELEMEIYLETGETFALSAVPRLLWVKKNKPELYNRAKYMNMINDWIVFKLTGKIVSEPSNSSTSGLFNLAERKWLPEVANKCGLKDDIFPPVMRVVYLLEMSVLKLQDRQVYLNQQL